jgi:hypothetical protein
MPINKISGGTVNLPQYLLGLAAGEIFYLPPGQGLIGTYGLVNSPQLNIGVTLSGQYMLDLGNYSVLQTYDSGMNYWRNVCAGGPYAQQVTVSADGYNYRIVNSTGCPVGALITTSGTGGVNGFYGYTQFGPVSGLQQAVVIQNGQTTLGNTSLIVTPSAGGSTWNAIVGGAVNSTISFSGTVYQNGAFGGTGVSQTASAGANYTRAPIILFAPPVNQGAQPYFLPSAICTISAGAINAITVLNQGAGLVALPLITVLNAPGDTTGGGAVLGWLSANSADALLGHLTALWPSLFGTAQTSVPTLAFSGASSPAAAAATAIMNFTITSFSGVAGVGYGTTPGGVINGGIVAGAADANPYLSLNLLQPLAPPLNITTATGVPTLASQFQGSGYQAIPKYCAIPNGTAAPSTANANTPNVGGANDVIALISL